MLEPANTISRTPNISGQTRRVSVPHSSTANSILISASHSSSILQGHRRNLRATGALDRPQSSYDAVRNPSSQRGTHPPHPRCLWHLRLNTPCHEWLQERPGCKLLVSTYRTSRRPLASGDIASASTQAQAFSTPFSAGFWHFKGPYPQSHSLLRHSRALSLFECEGAHATTTALEIPQRNSCFAYPCQLVPTHPEDMISAQKRLQKELSKVSRPPPTPPPVFWQQTTLVDSR